MSFEIARLREALETASRTGSAMGLTQSSKKCIENIVETSRLAVDIKKRHLSPGSTSGRAELMEDYKAFKSRIATMEQELRDTAGMEPSMLRSLKESHRVACVAKSEIEEGIKARTRAAPRSPLAAPALLEPIAEAVESGDAALVRKLLETFNGNIDAACDRHGSTLLHYAHMGGHPEVARVLKEAGASSNMRDAEGKRPADYSRALREDAKPDELKSGYSDGSPITSVEIRWMSTGSGSPAVELRCYHSSSEGRERIENALAVMAQWGAIPGRSRIVYGNESEGWHRVDPGGIDSGASGMLNKMMENGSGSWGIPHVEFSSDVTEEFLTKFVKDGEVRDINGRWKGGWFWVPGDTPYRRSRGRPLPDGPLKESAEGAGRMPGKHLTEGKFKNMDGSTNLKSAIQHARAKLTYKVGMWFKKGYSSVFSSPNFTDDSIRMVVKITALDQSPASLWSLHNEFAAFMDDKDMRDCEYTKPKVVMEPRDDRDGEFPCLRSTIICPLEGNRLLESRSGHAENLSESSYEIPTMLEMDIMLQRDPHILANATIAAETGQGKEKEWGKAILNHHVRREKRKKKDAKNLAMRKALGLYRESEQAPSGREPMAEAAGTVRKNTLYPHIRDAIHDGIREGRRSYDFGGIDYEIDWKTEWDSSNTIRVLLRDGPPGSTLANLAGSTGDGVKDILTRFRNAINQGLANAVDNPHIGGLDYKATVDWDRLCVDVKFSFTSGPPGYPTVVDNAGEPLTEAQRIGLEARRRLAESAGRPGRHWHYENHPEAGEAAWDAGWIWEETGLSVEVRNFITEFNQSSRGALILQFENSADNSGVNPAIGLMTDSQILYRTDTVSVSVKDLSNAIRHTLNESAGGFDQSTRYSGVRDFCDGLIPYVNGNLNGIEIVRNDEDELQSTRNMDFVSIDVRRTGGSKIFDAIICDGGSFGGHVADLAPYMEFDEDNFDYKVNFKSAAYTLEEWIEMVAENMDGLNESLAGGQGSPTAFMAGQKVGAMHGEYVRSALRCLPYNSRKHTFMDCETDLGGEEYVVVDEDDIVIANSSRLDDCNAFVRGVRAAQKAAGIGYTESAGFRELEDLGALSEIRRRAEREALASPPLTRDFVRREAERVERDTNGWVLEWKETDGRMHDFSLFGGAGGRMRFGDVTSQRDLTLEIDAHMPMVRRRS